MNKKAAVPPPSFPHLDRLGPEEIRTLVHDLHVRQIELETRNEELRRAQIELAAALEEKETLLREVHHRVKNNLQAIVSMTQMKAARAKDGEAAQPLMELMVQARAMAMVYERLFLSHNVAHIEMRTYLKELAAFVLEAFGGGRDIELVFDLEDLTLDIERALPCGMLVNELETNALKHAFPPGFAGKPVIRIGLRKVGEILRLTVADNGVGLPPGLEIGKTDSLGLRLSHLWTTQQLGGSWEIAGPPGAAFHVAFPAANEKYE